MSTLPMRPRRLTTNLRLPVPGDVDPASGPGAIGDLADRLEQLADAILWQPGDVKASAAQLPTPGWLLCDGTAVGRAAFPDLFAAIGVAYGAGDGSTTFNLPDLRGRAPVGAGQGAGLTARALGSRGGAETHTLGSGEMPTHAHAVNEPTHTHTGTTGGESGHYHHMQNVLVGQNLPGGGGIGGTRTDSPYVSLTWAVPTTNWAATGHTHGFTTNAARAGISVGNAGGGGGHNNMPPFQAVNWLIKT